MVFEPAYQSPIPSYRAIGDYSLIGDCRTSALVAIDGSIDWGCFPDFDSPALLSRLISASHGGYLAITDPETGAWPAPIRQRYIPSTAILQTEVHLSGTRLLITDFMPTEHLRGSVTPEPPPRIIRRIETLEQPCQLAIRFKASPDYARAQPRMTLNEEGVIVTTPGMPGVAILSFAHGEANGQLEEEPAGPYVSGQTLRAYESLTLVLGWASYPIQANQWRRAFRRDWTHEMEATRGYWQNWAAQTAYFGPYRPVVIRSAITLKLLTRASTETAAASPIASLAELIASEHNDMHSVASMPTYPPGIYDHHTSNLRESQDVRVSNRQYVLRILRDESSSSRADLARKTGLSRTTVGTIIADLLDKGLVQEGELLNPATTGGRRATRISFQPTNGLVISAQILADHIIITAADLNGRIVTHRTADKMPTVDPFPQILTMLHEVVVATKLGWEQVTGIGVALPSGMPSHIGPDLQQRLPVPIVCASPLSLGSYGEQRFGEGQRETTFIYVQLSPQIGCGLIRPGSSWPGEIFTLDDLLREQDKEELSILPEDSDTLLSDLSTAILSGNPLALSLLEKISKAVDGFSQLIHPGSIVLDCEDRSLLPNIIPIVSRLIAQGKPVSDRSIPVVASQTAPSAVTMGAISIALDSVFGTN
jgi:DNA-binding Lrp family transcriptional regulator